MIEVRFSRQPLPSIHESPKRQHSVDLLAHVWLEKNSVCWGLKTCWGDLLEKEKNPRSSTWSPRLGSRLVIKTFHAARQAEMFRLGWLFPCGSCESRGALWGSLSIRETEYHFSPERGPTDDHEPEVTITLPYVLHVWSLHHSLTFLLSPWGRNWIVDDTEPARSGLDFFWERAVANPYFEK